MIIGARSLQDHFSLKYESQNNFDQLQFNFRERLMLSNIVILILSNYSNINSTVIGNGIQYSAMEDDKLIKIPLDTI